MSVPTAILGQLRTLDLPKWLPKSRRFAGAELELA
jgi:hypothetical protein